MTLKALLMSCWVEKNPKWWLNVRLWIRTTGKAVVYSPVSGWRLEAELILEQTVKGGYQACEEQIQVLECAATLRMSQQRMVPNALWPGNKETLKWNLTGRPTASSLKVNTHKKAAGLLLAGLEMAEHFNHGVNSLCSKSERGQTSKTERSATCNQFQIDRPNQSNSIQEARNQTSNKAKFKEWRLERRSDIQQSNKHWKYTRRVKMVGGTQVLLIRARQDFKNGGGQQRERVEARTTSKRKSNRGTGTAWVQRVI